MSRKNILIYKREGFKLINKKGILIYKGERFGYINKIRLQENGLLMEFNYHLENIYTSSPFNLKNK